MKNGFSRIELLLFQKGEKLITNEITDYEAVKMSLMFLGQTTFSCIIQCLDIIRIFKSLDHLIILEYLLNYNSTRYSFAAFNTGLCFRTILMVAFVKMQVSIQSFYYHSSYFYTKGVILSTENDKCASFFYCHGACLYKPKNVIINFASHQVIDFQLSFSCVRTTPPLTF